MIVKWFKNFLLLLIFALFGFISSAQAEPKLMPITDVGIAQFANATNKILMSEYGRALDISLIDKPYRGELYDGYLFTYNGIIATCYVNKAGLVSKIVLIAKAEDRAKAPLQEATISMLKAAGLQDNDPHQTVKKNLYHIWCKRTNRRFVVDMQPMQHKGQIVATIRIMAYDS